MPQLLEVDDRGFTAQGVIGVHADDQIRIDGKSLHQIAAGWMYHHSAERPGGGERMHAGVRVRFDFGDEFIAPRG